MKKLLAILLAVMMLASLSTAASAEYDFFFHVDPPLSLNISRMRGRFNESVIMISNEKAVIY